MTKYDFLLYLIMLFVRYGFDSTVMQELCQEDQFRSKGGMHEKKFSLIASVDMKKKMSMTS